jgi:hypothetical protein
MSCLSSPLGLPCEGLCSYRQRILTTLVEQADVLKLKKESYRLLCTLEVLEQSFDARRQLLGKDRDVVRACVRRFPEEGLEMDFHSLRYAFVTYMLEKRFASNHSIDSRAQNLK